MKMLACFLFALSGFFLLSFPLSVSQPYSRADANNDTCIDMGELSGFLNRWKVDIADVNMSEIIQAIGMWQKGCDINECLTDNGGCDPLTVCTDTPGNRTCGSCPAGYTGDGYTGCVATACGSGPACQAGEVCVQALNHCIADCRGAGATCPLGRSLCDAQSGLCQPGTDPERIAVGAIRWDAWFYGSRWITDIEQPGWESRLPFFANPPPLRADTQDVMDQEIAYAKNGGIDYWAFGYYHPRDWYGNDFGWTLDYDRSLDLYLNSSHQMDVNYAISLYGGFDGPAAEWDTNTTDWLVESFKRPNYQKVLGNRPLVFFAFWRNSNGGSVWASLWGDDAAALSHMEVLRSKTVAAGLGTPYIVLMDFNPETAWNLWPSMHFDAVSAYAVALGATKTERSFYYCAKLSRDFWRTAQSYGLPLVPIFTSGWDYRPLIGRDPNGRNANTDWCAHATPGEIGFYLNDALSWALNIKAPAVLVYAWNELSEGGFIVPTLQEGTARLDAMRSVTASATRPVYRFTKANNGFVDDFDTLVYGEAADAGFTYIGVAFNAYKNRTAGMAELYRCRNSYYHYVSASSSCDSPSDSMEGSYGYVYSSPQPGHVAVCRYYYNSGYWEDATIQVNASECPQENAGWTLVSRLGYVPG